MFKNPENLRAHTLDGSPPVTLPRPLLFRLLRTTAVMWLIVRIAGFMLGIGSFSPPEVVLVSLLVLALIWVDIRAFREPLLFANLAIPPLQISWIVLSAAVTLDTVVALWFGEFLREVVIH